MDEMKRRDEDAVGVHEHDVRCWIVGCPSEHRAAVRAAVSAAEPTGGMPCGSSAPKGDGGARAREIVDACSHAGYVLHPTAPQFENEPSVLAKTACEVCIAAALEPGA